MSDDTPDNIDPHNIDDLITKAETSLQGEQAGSEEYAKALSALERLYKIRLSIRPEPTPVVVQEPVVDKDRMRFKDWAVLLVPLVGTGMIVLAEAFGHTLTSKAWGERKSKL